MERKFNIRTYHTTFTGRLRRLYSIYATDAISANVARELHNYSNRESVTAWCIVYIRSLFMSSFRFSIHFWYLRLFYSDGFPYFIAPAFSTPAFSTPAIYSHIFHSCIFHSRIFSAPLLGVMFR